MESIARKGIPKPSVLAAFLVPFAAEGKRHSRRGAKYPLRGTDCHVGLRPPRNDTSSASLRLTPVSLRVGRFAGLTGHRPVIQHREPLEGKAIWCVR